MNETNIEWVPAHGLKGFSWNPITGCLHGCDFCYARRRIAEGEGLTELDPDEVGAVDVGEGGRRALELFERTERNYPFGFTPTLHRYRLDQPAVRQQPARIFVGSMCDLLGAWVPRHWIVAVQEAMAAAPQHTFMTLTKNPKRYAEFAPWPRNVWPGATATDQTSFDRAVDALDAVCGTRFVSVEPLHGPVELDANAAMTLSWVIIGLETGPGARAVPLVWAERLVDQCAAFGVKCFTKNTLAGKLPECPREVPQDIMPLFGGRP